MAPGFYKYIVNHEEDQLLLPNHWVERFYQGDVHTGSVTIKLKGTATWLLEIQHINDTYVFAGGYGWKKLLRVLGLKNVFYVFFEPFKRNIFRMTYEIHTRVDPKSFLQIVTDHGSDQLVLSDLFAENFLQKQIPPDPVKLFVGCFFWKVGVDVEYGKFILCDGVSKLMRDMGVGSGYLLYGKIQNPLVIELEIYTPSGFQICVDKEYLEGQKLLNLYSNNQFQMVSFNVIDSTAKDPSEFSHMNQQSIRAGLQGSSSNCANQTWLIGEETNIQDFRFAKS